MLYHCPLKMPAADRDLVDDAGPPFSTLPSRLPFPPIAKSHILNCSVHRWYPKCVHRMSHPT